jgi:hypothetical protein
VESEGCFVRSFAEIYRASLVDGNARRLLRKLAATTIAKSETFTVATNGANNRRQLSLSLKLPGSAIESRCMQSDGISGGVAGL